MSSLLPNKIITQNVSITSFPLYGVGSTLVSRLKKAAEPTTDLEKGTPYGVDYGDISIPYGPFGPVVSWLTIKAGTYNSLNDNTSLTINEDITLTDVLINSKQDKNIVKTKVPGRAGTVKTFISSNDVDFQIEATIYNDKMIQGVYPAEFVKTLRTILSYPISLKIESPLINNIIGVNNIVIEDVQIPQIPGQYSQQKIYIRAVSDIQEDINLTPYKSLLNNRKL